MQRASPALTTGAILALIIFPFIDARIIHEHTFDVMGTMLSFITVGMSIYLIAKRNEKRDEEYFEKLWQMIRASEDMNESTKKLMNSYSKEAKDLVHLMHEIKMFKDQANKKEKID